MPKQISNSSASLVQAKTKRISKSKKLSFIRAAAKKGQEVKKPLWSTSEFKTGHWFSQTGYFRVTEIQTSGVTLQNSWGDLIKVAPAYLDQMQSATRFTTEQLCSKTQLAEILKSAGDSVMSVLFKKKLSQDLISEKIRVSQDSFKSEAKMVQLAHELAQGEECTMQCYLVQCEDSLGRSTVINLDATSENKFRQIDHRTIQQIILRGVKYTLRSRTAFEQLADEKSQELKVGDCFSGTRYLQSVSVNARDSSVMMSSNKGEEPIRVAKSVLETQMNCANVYSRELPMCRTYISQILEQAKNTCFTVQFRCQIDESTMLKKLQSASELDRQNYKQLANELLTGREHTIVGHLASSDGQTKLGRSLVRDLNQSSEFRLVDHRQIISLTIRDVKYVCK